MRSAAGIARIALSLLFCFASAAQEPPTRAPDESAFDEVGALEELRASIKGREEELSSKVFKNVEILGNVPAGRLLRIMEMGYARSLGVSCDHCHKPDTWESDELPGKQIARDMVKMVNRINTELLPSIEGLKLNPEKPIVNCTTCHRGQVKPALSMGK